MSAAFTIARVVVVPSRTFRSYDLELKVNNLRQRSVSNCTRVGIKHPVTMSSISNLLKTFNSAPPTAKVAFKTGVYIAGLGLALLLFPQSVIQLFSTSTSMPAVGWVRVGGTLASLFGFYYFGAALDDVEGRFPYRFYQSTVAGRFFLAVIFSALVLTEQSHMSLMVLVIANIASAIAMNRQIGIAVANGRVAAP